MLSKIEKKFSILFIVIVFAELVFSNINGLTSLHYITKPAILTSLIIFFWRNSSHLLLKTRNLMLLALSFSLLGDVLLMFVHKSANFFISGLIAFLIAHVFYILTFLKTRNKKKSSTPFSIILLIYAAIIFYFLHDGLGNLLIPVIIYMSVILFMAISAFLRKSSTLKVSYDFVFFGAILFMISDSLLALNKFYQPFCFADLGIIFTYALAQLFIVFGIKKQR